MKKIFAIVALMAFAGMASAFEITAPTVAVSYQDQKNDNHQQGHILNYNLTEKVTQNLSADLTVNNFQNDGSRAEFTRTELGVTPSYGFGMVTASARVSVGKIETSNHGDWGTYTVEPKLTATLPAGFEASVGYRRRAGFESKDLDTSNTKTASVSYALTKKDKVSLTFARLTGDNGGTADNGNKTYGLTYARSF
jgi:hypothetical protein